MAPKRGGGSRGGSSSISSCPGAFSETYTQANFANTVLFFVFFLVISCLFCSIRKKSGAGKKLVGPPYMAMIFLFLLSYALELVAQVLIECNTANLDTYYSLYIAINIFYNLATWLLLVLVVFVLNSMLREQLGGGVGVFRIIYAIICGVMFCLTCGVIGLTSYNNWTQTSDGESAGAEYVYGHQAQLRMAYIVLYLISIIASGVLSLITILSIRSRRLPGMSLLPWIVALYFCMVLWVLISLVFSAVNLTDLYWRMETSVALSYVLNFFQAMSCVVLLLIAKNAGWSKSTVSNGPQLYTPVAQQQQQPIYYGYQQQTPVYNGAPMPVGHAEMAQTK